MNANHARPMLAFWLVAAVAAVVTSLGLHDGGSRVSLRAGSPLPVTSPDSSPLVLGGDLRPVPTLAGTPSPGATLPSVASLQDAAGSTGEASAATPADSAKTVGSTTTRTRASSTTTARPTTRHRPGGSTSGATPTTSPTAPAHGRGQGRGHGNLQSAGQAAGPGSPGRGHGPTGSGSSGH